MNPDHIMLRAFKFPDLAKVDPNSSFIGKEDVLQSYNTIFTFTYEENPVACAGLVQLWPGVAEAWTVLGDWAKQHPIWFVKVLRHELQEQIKAMHLFRVQMHVEDDRKLLKWARIMGFHFEGTMKKYTKEGKTLHVLAMLPDYHG